MIYTECVAFVNNIEISSHTRIVLQYISLKSGLWSNLLGITETSTFNFPVEKESACTRKK